MKCDGRVWAEYDVFLLSMVVLGGCMDPKLQKLGLRLSSLASLEWASSFSIEAEPHIAV